MHVLFLFGGAFAMLTALPNPSPFFQLVVEYSTVSVKLNVPERKNVLNAAQVQ